MNAFIKKEVRLLLPNFLLAAGLAVLTIFFHGGYGSWLTDVGYFLACIFFPAIVVMLALNSFGVEVGTQTFPMMLAQPVSRQRIWQTKILLLALALAALCPVWFIAVALRLDIIAGRLGDIFTAAILFSVAVYTGAIWTVLLLRQAAAAFWFVLIIPAALLAVVAGLCGGSSDEFILGMIATTLGVYSLAGFFFGRWLFFRAQDLQWTGGAIVLPEWRGLTRAKAVGGGLRTWRPQAALWWKEIQLHQSQYVIAFALVVLHLGVLAVRKFYDLQHSPDLKFILEIFWGLWLVMPLLAGSAAVAEERKLGTLESQLCLPARRRAQFRIKFVMTLGLSILLGALMPLLLEGSRILPNVHFAAGFPLVNSYNYFGVGLGLLNEDLPLLTLLGIALVIGLASFYVSTMTRNTLQALPAAVLATMVAFTVIIGSAAPWNGFYHFLWDTPLACVILPLLLGLALMALAFRNFQSVLTDWRMGARNLLALVCALVVGAVITSGIYHRFWEKFTPFEPRHGPPKLSLANRATAVSFASEMFVHLPDGRIWCSRVYPTPPDNLTPMAMMLGRFKVELAPGKFVAGTNWLGPAHSYGSSADLKSDGTLWVSQYLQSMHPAGFQRIKGEDSDLAPLGTETNWVSVLTLGRSILLIRNDGTLWRWGPRDFDLRHKAWPGLSAFAPERMGAESNWASIGRTGYQLTFRKTDGTEWIAGDWNTNGTAAIEIEPDLVVHHAPGLDRGQMTSTALVVHDIQYMVGVRADGTFRIWADQRVNEVERNYHNYQWWPADRQIGAGSNWVAVAGNWERAVTLKNDGTLWLWNFRPLPNDWDSGRFEQEFTNTVPSRLGSHADWIAITGDDLGVTALAADGSLWFWPLADARQFAYLMSERLFGGNQGEPQLPLLLNISRKPQLLGNVFNGAD